MLLVSGLLCCNGTPLAGGDGVGRRCLDFAGKGRADARLLGSGRRLILDIDRFEAVLGDA
jgi:tRNA U54 and U55 pseudouridine synthase Pus10